MEDFGFLKCCVAFQSPPIPNHNFFSAALHIRGECTEIESAAFEAKGRHFGSFPCLFFSFHTKDFPIQKVECFSLGKIRQNSPWFSKKHSPKLGERSTFQFSKSVGMVRFEKKKSSLQFSFEFLSGKQ